MPIGYRVQRGDADRPPLDNGSALACTWQVLTNSMYKYSVPHTFNDYICSGTLLLADTLALGTFLFRFASDESRI